MSKRNLDGDVLGNRVNLGLAKSQKLLASMLGPAPESHATTAAIPEVDEDDYDFKKDFVDPEQCVRRVFNPDAHIDSHIFIGLALVACAPKTSQMEALQDGL